MALVYVHGGVSGTPKLKPSLAAAFEGHGGSAVDLVEIAVMALEDHPGLNAGYGAVLNEQGLLELDAGIADGATGAAGGVANIGARHPISVARAVMERTPHVLLTGAGAQAFAASFEQLDGTTPERVQRYVQARDAGELGPGSFGSPSSVDTVGAVALDDQGRLAAGSSTGGVFGKMAGRVGDAPIFGAGFYASMSAAVVGTGLGEVFLETLAALRVGALIEDGTHPQDACELLVRHLSKRDRYAATGLLALDAEGNIGVAFRGAMLAVEGYDGPIDISPLA